MKNCTHNTDQTPCVILMSGSGSNAESLLRYEEEHHDCPYHVTAVITDAPESSRAAEIAAAFRRPLLVCDIREFYASHGESSIKLDSPRRRELRDKWSMLLGEQVRTAGADFALFAGFIPLTNLAEHIPCLNVHPGDLTRTGENGERIYAGLHLLPVERAILNGEATLRSSVILVQPYSGSGHKEMDAGPVLGISAPLPIDLEDHPLEELQGLRDRRTPGVPCRDILRQLALKHIEELKIAGDHVIFPRVAADFAAGAFDCSGNILRYKGSPVISVEYTVHSSTPLLLQ